jgi:ribosomal protein S6--L-glutamate ligase
MANSTMIVSFHPLFEADKNIICAGREPNAGDLTAIKAARAVILPQGCRRSLYEMARKNCDHVFPNYKARFDFPGKIGQIRLFRETNTSHPQTELYPSVADFSRSHGKDPVEIPFALPYVFKFDWGGEGETVYLIKTPPDLKEILDKAARFEHSGQKGFLLQQYVPAAGKTLRVIIIGETMISYWRIQTNSDEFMSSVSRGAHIDPTSQPELQNDARALVYDFCRKTGINLAGFDIIFSSEGQTMQPLLLEINYFFGRKGLGGSQAYYKILKREIHNWLGQLDLEK